MTRLIDLLDDLSARDPDGIAVIDEGDQVSFAAFAQRVRRTAAWLARVGLRAGDAVGITVRDEFRHLALCYALMRLGCRQVILASQEPALMRAALAARCGVNCVIGDSVDDALDGYPVLVPDDEAIAGERALDAFPVPPAPMDAVAVLLTSAGPTGRPKILACTQERLSRYQHITRPGRSVVYRPNSRDSNQWTWTCLANLSRGHTLVFCDPRRNALEDVVRRHRVNDLSLSPVAASSLARAAEDGHDAMRFAGVRLITGGDSITGALRGAIQRTLTRELYVNYGATECGIVTTAGPDVHERDPASVGPPIAGVELRVVDENGSALPACETGFVRIRTACSATAYYDDDEASARMFRDGWFQPGDIGWMGDDGMLRLVGRDHDLMILSTINIFPKEIESVADSFPGVVECAAFSLRSSAYGDIPLLAVVARDTFDASALLAHCRERLGTRAPRKIVTVAQLPRNSQGKVQRRDLSALFGSAP